MPDTTPGDIRVVETAVWIVGRLQGRLGELTDSTRQLVVAEVAELRGDAQLQQLMYDTVTASIETFFSVVRHGITIQQAEPPTAALEYARRLAQRDVSANALVRAYRLGHRAVLRAFLDELRAAQADVELSLDVHQLMVETSFRYIDWLSQRVLAVYQDERERWVVNRNSLRELKIRELLAGAAVDIDAMTIAIGYPLRRTHLAIVLWRPDSDADVELAPMERFSHRIAESIGSREAVLFIPVDQATAWVWIPLAGNAAATVVERARSFAEATPNRFGVAIGRPLPGADGFRRSHQQAQDARAVVLASSGTARLVISADDPGLAVAALLGDNVGAAATLVGEVLGPLASATDSDDRLRETLWVFLRTGSSYTAAAEVLHLHHNSVKYRVQRAMERRGRPITDDRCDVELALILCHWFGAAVLS